MPRDTGSKRALACGHFAFRLFFVSLFCLLTFIRASPVTRRPCLLGIKKVLLFILSLFFSLMFDYVHYCLCLRF